MDKLNYRNILLVCGTWLLAYVWKIGFLGFYSDDYVFILEAASFNNFSEIYAHYRSHLINRPVCLVLISALSLLFKDSAILWQSYLSLVVLVNSILIYILIEKINKIANFVDEKYLYIFPSLWLVLPINLGFTAWPTMAAATAALTFFILSFIFLFNSQPLRKSDQYLSLLFFALSVFTYEIFYLQFVPMLLLVFLSRKNLGIDIKRLSWLTIGFILTQGLAAGYNRLVSGGVRKSFDIDFIINRVIAVINNPKYLYMAAIPILITIFFSYYVFKMFVEIKKGKEIKLERKTLILVVLSAWMISALIYLLAGYSIRPFGLGSRTTIVFSLWLSILLFALPIFSVSLEKKNVRYSVIAFFISFFVMNIYQSYCWISSWKIQKEVMKSFPVEKIQKFEDTLLVAITPNYFRDVIIFEEDTTFQYAVRYHFPELEKNNIRSIVHKHQGFRQATLDYRSEVLTRTRLRSGHKGGAWKAKKILLWNYFTKDLFLVNKDLFLDVGVNYKDFSLSPEMRLE